MIDANRRRLPELRSRPAVSAFRAEWERLVQSRATWAAVAVIAAMTIGLAVLVAAFATPSATPAMQIVFAVLKATMLGAGVLGAVSVTGAKRRPVGDAAPRLVDDAAPRPVILIAGATAFAALTFLLASAIYACSVFAVAPILTGKGIALELGNVAATWVPVLAASLSTALIGVIGRMIGEILPSRAVAVAATVGMLFALPLIVGFASLAAGAQPWLSHVTSLLPLAAAKNVVFADEPGTGRLPSPVALLVLGTWAAAAVWGASAGLRRRAGRSAVERLRAAGA